MSETIAFCAALFLMLYGVFSIIRQLSLLLLKPSGSLFSFSVAYLHPQSENAEQIIHYFRARAEREDILLLVDDGISNDERAVIEKLCENRRDIRFIGAENFDEENCIYGKDTI